jgi:glycosyltransferase involved in cell wall biosynthesis
VVVDGENGLYVPPGDVGALRAAIERLLADEALAEALGANGRAYVERECEVTRYAERIAADVRTAIAARTAAAEPGAA